MSDAEQLVKELRALGIKLRVRGRKIKFGPKSKVTPELLLQIRKHHDEITDVLRSEYSQRQKVKKSNPVRGLGRFKKNLAFIVLGLIIVMFPFFYLVSNWKRDVGDAGESNDVPFPPSPSLQDSQYANQREQSRDVFAIAEKMPLFDSKSPGKDPGPRKSREFDELDFVLTLSRESAAKEKYRREETLLNIDNPKNHQNQKQWVESQSKNPLFQIRQVMWNNIQQKKPIVLKDGQEIRLFELPEEQARQYLRHFIKTNHPDLYDEYVDVLIDETYKHSTKAKIRLNEHTQLLMSSKRNQKQSKEIAKKTDDLRIYFERQGYWSAIEDLNKMVQDFNQNIGR